jgi:hypothetical protein
VHVAPPFKEPPQVFVSLYGPVAWISASVMAVVPKFFRLTVRGAEVLPKAVSEKCSDVADCESSVPCPVKLIVCGLLGSLSTTVIVPVAVPAVVGVKVTFRLQLLKTGTLPPQRLAVVNGPVVVMEWMVMAVVEEGLVN